MSDEEEETLLVCCRADSPSPFTDNVEGVCARCGTAIFWRPHAPENLTHVCMGCAREDYQDCIDRGEDVEITLTPPTIAEVMAWAKKRSEN